MNDLQDKIAGALYGVAVGDALGAPLEFMSADEIQKKHGHVTEMIGGGWLHVAPGEITDDTEMTLCVAEGIAESPGNPIPAIGRKFIEWYRSRPKDIGGTCAASINAALTVDSSSTGDISTNDWHRAARATADRNGGRSGGNGALMRTVYPALFYPTNVAVVLASKIGQMTHWDANSSLACVLYSQAVGELLGASTPGSGHFIISRILSGTVFAPPAGQPLSPTGYVVDSFRCVASCILSTSSFETAIAGAANLGGDADTIAAIAGGLVGAYYGFSQIPTRWVAALSPDIRARLDALVDAALAQRSEGGIALE